MFLARPFRPPLDGGLHAAEAGGADDDPHCGAHRIGRPAPPTDLEGQHRAEPVHLGSRPLVPGIVRQTRVPHPGHRGMRHAAARPARRPIPATGPVARPWCAARAAPGTPRAHPGCAPANWRRRDEPGGQRPGRAVTAMPEQQVGMPADELRRAVQDHDRRRSDSGRCPSGVAKVLSTTTSAPVPWPNRHSSGRSATSISGLVGDSSHSRSAAQAASLVAAVSVMSTVADLPPAVCRAVGEQRAHARHRNRSAPPRARRSAPGRGSPPPRPSRTRRPRRCRPPARRRRPRAPASWPCRRPASIR